MRCISPPQAAIRSIFAACRYLPPLPLLSPLSLLSPWLMGLIAPLMRFAAGALLVCIASVAAAQASLPALTLDAALDAAQAWSATLPAQDAAARSAQELAVAAGRLPDPVLRLSVNNLPAEGPGRFSVSSDFMTMRSIGLVQTYTSADKRKARSARYERMADASLSGRAIQKAKLMTHTASAWLDRYFQEQMLHLLQQQREDAVHLSKAVEATYRGARGSQADVLAAHAAIAQIDVRMHEAQTDIDNAKALLQRWVGDAGLRPLGAPPPIDSTRHSTRNNTSNTGNTPNQSSHADASALMGAIDQFPDVAALRAREQVALAEAEVARQDKTADWSWSLMYSKRGGRFGDMVSVGVSIPLQWDQTQKQDRAIAAQLERVEQVRLEREELRRERLYDVQRLIASWRSKLQRVQDYDQTLIPLAADRVTATQAAFRGGSATLVDVLQAQRMVTDARLERLRMQKQAAMWWAELEFAIPLDQAVPAITPQISHPTPTVPQP